MNESARVQRWRDAKRQKGLKPCTIWLTADEEFLLKDLAAKRRCSPSEILQQALAYFHAGSLPVTATATDTAQLREMIRAEIATLPTASAPVATTITDTAQLRVLLQEELATSALVTATVTDTVTATLPALVRAIVEGLALESLGLSVTATSNSSATETTIVEEAPAQRGPGRTRGAMRQRILTLLVEHTEGLSAEEIRAYLKVHTSIGDTLQSMKRAGVVSVQGQGKGMRYSLAR